MLIKILDMIQEKIEEFEERHMSERERKDDAEWDEFLTKINGETIQRRAMENYIKENGV